MKYPSCYCHSIVQTVIKPGTDSRCSMPAVNEDFSKRVTCQFNILYFRATDICKDVFTANRLHISWLKCVLLLLQQDPANNDIHPQRVRRG